MDLSSTREEIKAAALAAGLTVKSKATKAQMLEQLGSVKRSTVGYRLDDHGHVWYVGPPVPEKIAAERAERDALKRTRITIFDPSANLTDRQLRTSASQNRRARRHRSFKRDGVDVSAIVPREHRAIGAMRPAVKIDLAYGRSQAKSFKIKVR